jgi:hypothetical protein
MIFKKPILCLALCLNCLVQLAGIVPANSASNLVAVYPSGASVPERLLRISLEFDRAPEVSIIDRVNLRLDDGSVLRDAFLSQELWSPDRKILTLLFAPARVKSGLIANEEFGRALKPNTNVSFFLDGSFLHRWHVTAGGCKLPDPRQWLVSSPIKSTREDLIVTFDGSVDFQSYALIAIADSQGQRVSGIGNLNQAETRWIFRPTKPWTAGSYHLVIHPRFETPCGDEVGEGFEHLEGQGLGSNRASLNLAVTID